MRPDLECQSASYRRKNLNSQALWRINVCECDTNRDEENDTDGFVYEGEKSNRNKSKRPSRKQTCMPSGHF